MNAKLALRTSLVTLTLALAACTAPSDLDDGSEEGADALKKIGDVGGGGVVDPVIDPVGPVTPVTPGWPFPGTPRKTPRVLSRSASGSTVTLKLDRALAADELDMAKVKLLAVRKQGASFVNKNLAASASLSADKTVLTINMSEPVKAGEIYFPRGEWRPCLGSNVGSKCRVRPANFGDIVAKSKRTWPIFDIDQVFTQSVNKGTFTKTATFGNAAFLEPNATFNAGAAPQTSVMLAEEPLPEQGTFRVKSMTPAADSTNVDRTTDKVIITFEGGTIDCAKTGRGQGAFHLHSVSPDVYDQQSMYEDPQYATPSVGTGYRGHIRCEEDTNRLVFTTPGVLLGDSWFQVDLNAWSKEGNFMGNKVLEFKTKRPGLQVLATRIENHYGGDNTCDNDIFGTNYCDIYVTTAIATAGGGQPSRIPEQGDFGGMKKFSDDAVSGSRDLYPNRVLYANANPIDEVVDIQMWGVDADDDSTWKKVFETAGKIAGAMATALTPIKPEAGAIAEGVSAGFLGLAEIIPTNEDDFLGSGRFIFTASGQRWGTQATYPIQLDLSKNSPDRGPVRVFLRTEELPLSWRLPGPIL